MSTSDSIKPLEGIKVLDFAQFLAGPVAALRLSDLGAEVIKIERPDGGDLCRSMIVNGQTVDGDSLVFHTFNRGKKSVAADLKSDSDLKSVWKIIETADVMIHNFRPGVMERIGLGYEAVKNRNPRIVYGSVSGYGTKGPWHKKPGQDLLVQALSGLLWLNGNASDGPVPIGFAALDVATAGNLVQGILACLLRRSVTGQGGLVEVDLLSTAIDMTFEQFTCFLNDDLRQPVRHEQGNANPYQPAPYGVYPTANGFLALAMAPIKTLAELLESPELQQYEQEQTFEKLNEIKSVVANNLIQQNTEYWIEKLEPHGIWCMPVLDWPEFVNSDGFKALNPIQTIVSESGQSVKTTSCPIRIDGMQYQSAGGAPALGQDTNLIFNRK